MNQGSTVWLGWTTMALVAEVGRAMETLLDNYGNANSFDFHHLAVSLTTLTAL